jgi:hypothetical protein
VRFSGRIVPDSAIPDRVLQTSHNYPQSSATTENRGVACVHLIAASPAIAVKQ